MTLNDVIRQHCVVTMYAVTCLTPACLITATFVIITAASSANGTKCCLTTGKQVSPVFTSISYLHCQHSRRNRVYETVRCPSVCPSVCLSQHGPRPQQQTRCCRLAAVDPAGRRYRSIAAAAAAECGQCHVVSVRRLLNTDLLHRSRYN